jgi:hypothetical protein
MESVYTETSFVSLLVGRPSRDLVTAANQQVTRDWWRLRRTNFLCLASAEVVREASRGDSEEVRKRLEILRELPMIRLPLKLTGLCSDYWPRGCCLHVRKRMRPTWLLPRRQKWITC